MLPDAFRWRWIVVNSSVGKDSQTALRATVRACDEAAIPRSRIVVSHQCLGEVEWPGVVGLVHEQAQAYGLRVEVTRYRAKDGTEPTLLDYVRRRRKWPDSAARYFTSEFKRGPGGRLLVRLHRESPGPILNVYGLRSEESPARASKKPFTSNARFSCASRPVWDWLPIHSWTEAEVWADIKASGVRHHPAYDLGMPRLSCCFCVFAPRAALAIAAKANPELFERYRAVETEIGHTFRKGFSLASIASREPPPSP